MSLLLLFAQQRARQNAGHAEIPVTEATGRGAVRIPAGVLAALLPKPKVIRGHGRAAIDVTVAYGDGRLVEEHLIALLLSAA